MPTNPFSRLDSRVSAAVDRKMGEPIEWRPMGPVKTYGDAYTKVNLPKPDAIREVVKGWTGTVVWKTDRDTDGNSPVTTGTICVEIDRKYLRNGKPRKGDYLYCVEQDPGEQILEVGSVSDDGGERVDFWCKLVVMK